jgi:hypothetical protein
LLVFLHGEAHRLRSSCRHDRSPVQGKEYRAHLLRRSVREGKRVRKQTLANLSALPDEAIAVIRRVLAGEALVAADELFHIARSRPHGHVAAVAAMARTLGLPGLLGPACRQRDLAFALIVARACEPGSKLARPNRACERKEWRHNDFIHSMDRFRCRTLLLDGCCYSTSISGHKAYGRRPRS